MEEASVFERNLGGEQAGFGVGSGTDPGVGTGTEKKKVKVPYSILLPGAVATVLFLCVLWILARSGIPLKTAVWVLPLAIVLGVVLYKDREKWQPVFLAVSAVCIGYAAFVMVLFTHSHFTADSSVGYGGYLVPALVICALLILRTIYKTGKLFNTTVLEVQDEGQWHGVRMEATYFQVPDFETLILAAVAANVFYLLFTIVPADGADWSWWAVMIEKFTERGPIPALTMWLFCWAVIILILKMKRVRKDKLAKRIVFRRLRSLQEGGRFAEERAGNLINSTLNPYAHSIFTKRLDMVSNGQSDPAVFSAQAELERSMIASSHTALRFIIWAIPVLGFLGTVWGISLSVSELTKVLSDTARQSVGATATNQGFGEALAGLGIAFDTTVVALSLSVFAMLFASYVRKMEDDQVTEAELLMHHHLN